MIPESVTSHIARPFIRQAIPKFADFKSLVRAIEFNNWKCSVLSGLFSLHDSI
jgi:hypothetical protein